MADRIGRFVKKEFTKPVRLKSRETGKFLDEPNVTIVFDLVETPSRFQQRIQRAKPIIQKAKPILGRVKRFVVETSERLERQERMRKRRFL